MPESNSVRWISAEDVRANAPYAAAMHALRGAFANNLCAPARHVHSLGPENSAPADARLLLLMPAWEVDGLAGVKLVTYMPANARRGQGAVNSVYIAINATTGVPLAFIEGRTLTNVRTASLSALAASYLARPDSRSMLLVGTGDLAPHLALAHHAHFGLEQVLIWGRRPEAAANTADTLRSHGLNARPVESLEAGLKCADIVSCATSSTCALLNFKHIRPGTHIDLVGGFTPEMREADDETVARSTVVLETIQGVSTTAGDIVQPLRSGAIDAAHIRYELQNLIDGTMTGRRTREEITLFKSVGDAREDLCVARLLVTRALAGTHT